MNKQEFFAAVKAYKEGKPLRPKVSRDYTIDDWADQYYDQAVALKAKALLAHSCDRSFDEDIYNQQLCILTHMLDGMDESAEILANIESDAKEVLEHGEWKKHKYIRIENGRYIYADDLKKQNNSSKSAPKSPSGSDKKTVRIENGKYVVETEADRNNRAEQIKKEEFEAKKSSDFAQAKRDSVNRVDQWLDRYGENPANLSNPIYQQQQAKKDQYEQQANKLDINAKGHQQTADELKKKQNSSYMTEDDIKDARRQSDESAAKAQKEGEAMAAWKKAQAEKETVANINGHHNAQHQAEAEGQQQQEWKDKQAKKTSLKNEMVDETISMLIDYAYGKKDSTHAQKVSSARVNLVNDHGWDEKEDSSDMKEYVQKVEEAWRKKRDSVDSKIRGQIDNQIMSIVKQFKHSIEPLSGEEYCAAIQQYHANTIEHRGFSKASGEETLQQRWERLYLQRAINDLKNNPHWRSSASKLKDDLDWWTDQPKYFDELNSLSSEEYRETMKKIIRGAGMFSGRGNEKLAHSIEPLSKDEYYAAIEEYKRKKA